MKPPDNPVGPYPAPKTKINDQAVKDGGGNFGRLARIPALMDSFTTAMRRQPIAGIPVQHWIAFFKSHAEAKDPASILDRLGRDLRNDGMHAEAAERVVAVIKSIVAGFDDPSVKLADK